MKKPPHGRFVWACGSINGSPLVLMQRTPLLYCVAIFYGEKQEFPANYLPCGQNRHWISSDFPKGESPAGGNQRGFHVHQPSSHGDDVCAS